MTNLSQVPANVASRGSSLPGRHCLKHPLEQHAPYPPKGPHVLHTLKVARPPRACLAPPHSAPRLEQQGGQVSIDHEHLITSCAWPFQNPSPLPGRSDLPWLRNPQHQSRLGRSCWPYRFHVRSFAAHNKPHSGEYLFVIGYLQYTMLSCGVFPCRRVRLFVTSTPFLSRSVLLVSSRQSGPPGLTCEPAVVLTGGLTTTTHCRLR